jgi:hypothetical protein
MPSTFPPRTHTARREHTCAECGQPIPVGAPYDAQTTIDRASVSTRRTHTTCTPGPTDHLF